MKPSFGPALGTVLIVKCPEAAAHDEQRPLFSLELEKQM